MLTLLPFEAPYFEKVGLPCTWVGHPAVAEGHTGDGAAFRQKYEIPEHTPLFSMLPGSRKSEIERHMPIFAKAITLLSMQFPNLALAVAVPKNVLPIVAPYFKNCPFRAVVMANEEEKRNAISASDLAITKSGTVALEVAMAGVPMIVTYRVNPLSAWYVRRHCKVKTVNLVNILEDREAIPELLQENCTPIAIASAVAHLLTHPQRQNAQRIAQKDALEKLLLPDGLPSDKAANTILGLLSQPVAVH